MSFLLLKMVPKYFFLNLVPILIENYSLKFSFFLLKVVSNSLFQKFLCPQFPFLEEVLCCSVLGVHLLYIPYCIRPFDIQKPCTKFG